MGIKWPIMGMGRGIMGSKWLVLGAGISNLCCVGFFMGTAKPVYALCFAVIFVGMCILARKE